MEEIFPPACGEPSQPWQKCEEEAAERRCYKLTTTPLSHPPLCCSEAEDVEYLDMKV